LDVTKSVFADHISAILKIHLIFTATIYVATMIRSPLTLSTSCGIKGDRAFERGERLEDKVGCSVIYFD
jgi:hypothetical protein